MNGGARRFGRYELLAELGRGGMAEVHLARLHGIGGFSKLLAIKLMLPHLSQNPQFVEQFLNEGRIAARISHPNVCQVFELGDVDGQLFLAMEYLAGATWEELLRAFVTDRAMLVRAITGVFAQACEGLYHAHELRDENDTPTPVIHRDISPQNLFITVDGACKILDFGVAKMGATGTHTRTGVLKGKLPYMSPEQIKGAPLDARSDVFAVGVILWEAFANRPLFLREAEFQTWKAIAEGPIDRVSTWEPAYGADVDTVVMRALARDPEHRHASMRDLATDLRRLGDGWGGALTPAELGELVRNRCRDKLDARSVQLATLEAKETLVPSARNVATVADQVAVLRDDSVVVGHPRRRRWWRIAIGVSLIGVAAAIATVVTATSNAADLDANTASARPVQEVSVAVAAANEPERDAAVLPTTNEPVAPDPKPAAKEPRSKRRVASRIKQQPAPAPSARLQPAKLDPGMLSVSANPSARVYIDGVFVDETPLFQHTVSAGRHEVRIVPAEGGPTVRRITIESGRVLNLGTLKL